MRCSSGAVDVFELPLYLRWKLELWRIDCYGSSPFGLAGTDPMLLKVHDIGRLSREIFCTLHNLRQNEILAQRVAYIEPQMPAFVRFLLCHGQHRRNILVCGACSQDVSAITFFKLLGPNYRSLLLRWSSNGGRSGGQIRCSSSSARKTLSPSSSASGEAQMVEQLWEQHFANPSQWWDYRVDKRSPNFPDFKHKTTKEALWIDGWSTPSWVKAMLNHITQNKSQSHVGYRTTISQDLVHQSSLPRSNNKTASFLPSNGRVMRRSVQGGDGNLHLKSANTASEAIAVLKSMPGRGVAIDSYMCVEVLKRCSKDKNFVAAKYVRDCIFKSGMEQNIYVANSLLSVFMRCGRLEDARRVFDNLVKKSVLSWNIMIGGYAQHNHAKDAMELFNKMRQEDVKPDEFAYLSILKACARSSSLIWGKQVHAYIRHAGCESGLRVGSALVHMYAKSGSIDDARLVFDGMEERDVMTWTMMISAYAGSGLGKEAYRLFLQMKHEGLKPDVITYLSVLNACASVGALEWVKEVHRDVVEAGLESDLRVGSALVHKYAKSGSIVDARLVFDRMEERDVITWNMMIGAYAGSGLGEEAYRLFLQMRHAGLKPDAITYLSVLNACASVGALEWVKEVHKDVVEVGLESDLRVGSALVHMYAKSGSIDDARLVFDRMEKRNVITWTGMIGAYAGSGLGEEAYRLFLQMKHEGFNPDAITYLSILNACASAGALEWVKEVHRDVHEAGLESDLRVGSALARMYAKSGSIDDARLVFDRMEKRNVITWNMMIGAYAESGLGEEAYRLFLQMKHEGFKPDAITYVSILNACASAGALEWVQEVYRNIVEAGLESDLRVGNALVHMYAKSGNIDDAREFFDRMKQRDVITWTGMIGAFVESGRGEEAYRLFLQMKQEGFKPNAITFINLLNGYPSVRALEWVKKVHSHILEAGLESDVRLGNALVYLYAKSGSINDARVVFDRTEERDVITWTAMIGAYAENGCGEEAYRLFLQLKQKGFKPDAITYVSILNACASAGALEWVKEIHNQVLEAGLESDVRVASALVHMYAKSGSIEYAGLVFDRMEKRDVITWNVMIGGLAQHGCGHEALAIFRRMLAGGVKPDGASFVAVLSACSHAGLVDEGRRLFLAMAQDHGIEPSVVHCTCMVDLLGRAGHLEEAKLFINNMPVEANGATWGALLGACRTYADVELGELAAKQLMKLDPKDASAYVLLSNIYAGAGKWGQVSLLRTLMEERGIRKEPGRSWIEVDNKIHHFVAGDTSHSEVKEIYAELSSLTERIKAEGYIPDTQLVLHNIDEDDKDLALCSHSEKLAIAYGLMHTSPGNPIYVYKNLRVCSDCHATTKLFSKVTGQEIVVRDANRFHHFKDGACSCDDYW